MNIEYDATVGMFHLHTSEMSYAFGIAPDKRILNLYWGAALTRTEELLPLARETLCSYAGSGGVDRSVPLNFEVPTREPWDYGDPVLWVHHPDGNRGLRLVYESHEIQKDCLTVMTRDAAYPIRVAIHYRGWGDLPLLTRWITISNLGDAPLELQAVKSAAWYVPAGQDYRLTHLSGNWGCEYGRNQLMLTQARTVLQNTRVTSSAAQQTPFFALDRGGEATETGGEVFFGVLQWGGDFNLTVERQFGKRVTVTGGINEFDSSYCLKPGESFETPGFTGGFSGRGFEHMSEVLYDWQLDDLLPRGKISDKAHSPRPVIYNSWYPYEFSVDESNCMALVDRCASLGVELFVIDDGWMPGRVSDRAGLGDWVADPARFPHGMKAVSDACHAKNMLFGLWVEPEMVNPDSDLYRAHPDWVIRIPTREQSLQRHQLVLNLARDEIRDWAIDWLDRIIRDFKLDYLKWDMNRYVTENGWPDAPLEDQPSLSIRYTQNLMLIWQHLNERFPDVLFENCAAGGGRTSFAMIPYADRINRSDNADPVDLMVLHEGFSMLFVPKTAGGAGNIAPAVHHIHKRPTPLDFRIHWGMTGSLSIGVNLLTAPEDEIETLKHAVQEYKRLRGDLQDAYVYRIASARENPYALFQYVRRDRGAFTLFAFGHGMRCWDLPMPRFRMRGLDPYALYRCEDGQAMTGEALMNIGLPVHLKGDCDSLMSVWHREK